MSLKLRRTVTVVETWTVTFGEIGYPLDGVVEAPGSDAQPAAPSRWRFVLAHRIVSTESVIILRPPGRPT